ncbi:MAG: MFS transporter [Gammaproteobacteria bacterium]|nr:MFS transporter [Gammaproteobacteria bacterium]
MARNIWLLYGIRAIRSFYLFVAILVPFYQSNGLNQQQIFWLQSVIALMIVIGEIPTGMFADRYGRRLSILIGAVLSVVGVSLYVVSYGFFELALSVAVLGVSISFISGADSAMAYDSLLTIGKSENYRGFEANRVKINGYSEAIGSLIGGFLALVSLRFTFVIQAGVYLLLIPLALMLTRTVHHKPAVGQNVFKDVKKIVRYSLHDHAEIKWLIIYAALLGTMVSTMTWFTQPYYQLVDIPLALFGVLWAIQLLVMAYFAQFSYSYEAWLGKSKAMMSFLFIGLVCYLVLAIKPSIWVLPFILGFYFIRALQTAIIQDYVNGLVESSIRATVLSVKSLAHRLLYVFVGPLLGAVMDVYSLQAALLVSAGLFGIGGTVVLWQMHRLKVL